MKVLLFIIFGAAIACVSADPVSPVTPIKSQAQATARTTASNQAVMNSVTSQLQQSRLRHDILTTQAAQRAQQPVVYRAPTIIVRKR